MNIHKPSFKINRRKFIQVTGCAALSAGCSIQASEEKVQSETLVKEFYKSLSSSQKKVMAFPWDHKKQSYISNNWDVVDPDDYSIGEFYSSSQQKLIHRIFSGLLTVNGRKNYMIQMKDDAGGFGDYTCATFGDPSTGKFEWVLTGRHLTLRADGNSIDKVAFGGPVFYGHAPRFAEKPHHPGNVWWHQAVKANELFKALDATQQKAALLDDAPGDHRNSAKLRPAGTKFDGISGKSLNEMQKKLLQETLDSLFASYRNSDVEEAVKYLHMAGGLDSLHIAFYEEDDLGDDRVWDRWRIEGPGFVWYYRGSPHVHSWVNIGEPT
ncbi:MAG: DUF3500 domain-containing protein [Lentisphaerales bacterium]|nr:DUF3500 domain-containing protein [Lentisphaerales bacterium]